MLNGNSSQLSSCLNSCACCHAQSPRPFESTALIENFCCPIRSLISLTRIPVKSL